MSDAHGAIHSLLDFSGKTALVAGVLDEHSIAWPIAKYLNDAGARVALSIQRKAVRRLMGAIPQQLTDPLIVECDVGKDEEIERMFIEIGQSFGHLDFLIHSIAYAPLQTFEKRFVEVARADFALTLDVSAYSLIALARGALPLMKERGGCILAMTYLAGEKVIPGYQVMSVAKAALDNIIKNLAYDLAPYRIRVNGLSPGPTATKAGTAIPGFSLMQAHMREFAPLQSEISNTDAGKAALFLCSAMAEKITGEIVHIDGGYNILGMTLKRPEGVSR
ncbi:MAG TPA: enoyl-ACP reductase [Methylomirabilota bacterium]|nr:enoyl-ACP reductase [Methylomirabilota bacterium]